ncbi:hypothetical protein V496_08829 [Pseudogymnoascus sp. VKM F-4515 (FW-2607)]|nr:hypothetical protein V496_08829 [Pseudogymnoascus sp. VKM F-4515 (FW-2607)]
MEKVTGYSTVVQLLERKKSDGERGKIDENRDITGHAFPTWPLSREVGAGSEGVGPLSGYVLGSIVGV